MPVSFYRLRKASTAVINTGTKLVPESYIVTPVVYTTSGFEVVVALKAAVTAIAAAVAFLNYEALEALAGR